MTKIVRTAIFYIFLILFLISAPLVILYTSGYRYSLRHNRFEQLGALIIKSSPRDADIYLNGKKIKERAPAFLRISPNEYEVEIKKDGYQSWKKRLNVLSRQTTFAENIVLWTTRDPSLITGTSQLALVQTSITDDLHFVINVFNVDSNQYQIQIYNLLLNREELISQLTSAVEPKIKLSPSGSSALIEGQADNKEILAIARFDPPSFMILPHSVIQNFTKLSWGETDATLYGEKNGFISALNLYNNQTNPITRGGDNFIFRGTAVWSVNEVRSRLNLLRSMAGNTTDEPQTELELQTGSYEFLPIEAPFLLLHEKNNSRLLIFNTRDLAAAPIELRGDEIATRTNSDGELEIAHWNNFEIWRTNITNNNTELIRRQSEPIEDVLWYPQGEYIIYSSQGKVSALELDNRDERNMSTLIQFDNHKIKNISVDARGLRLYFSVIDGPRAGVYSLESQ